MDFWTNVTTGIAERLQGPLKFRLILQPAVATFIAVRAGLKDAKEGRPAYFWAALFHADGRAELIREGWKQIAKLFVMAAVMDLIYQFVVHSRLSLKDSMFVAVLLAVVPYLMFRGLANRIASRVRTRSRPPR